nr:hypothetical protein [Tanacetum cinerariifolium]
MTTVNQGMSVEEIEQVVAQRMDNAIQGIAIYETKTILAHKSMSQTERQEEKVPENASNKRKWESNHNGSLSQQNKGHKCGNYKKVGHIIQNCRTPATAKNQQTRTCYKCGSLRHYKSECPIVKFHKRMDMIHEREKFPDLLSHRGFEIFQPSAECPMKIHGKNIPTLDVPRFHFYPLDQLKNGAHDGYNCPSQVPFIQTLPSFTQQYPCCENCGGLHETFLCKPMNYFESNPSYESNYFGFDQIEPPQYSVNPSLNIQNAPDDHELFISKLIQQKLQNEYAQPFLAIAITFDLSAVETEDSLIMGDEHLDTIPTTESDEFIKSSVENLVPSLNEYEDLSDNECDVPACDDFTTFSNILFDVDDDFSSIDDESFSDEDILKKIYSNPLFDEEIISMKIDPQPFNVESDLIESLLNHDFSIISSSSKIDSLLDEFAGELILLKLIPSGIDETNCDPEEENRLIEKLLYDNSSPRPSEEFIFKNSDAEIESFSQFPIPVEDSDSLMEEINLSFTPDDPMPPGIEEDDYDSERDILIFEELLSNDSLSIP